MVNEVVFRKGVRVSLRPIERGDIPMMHRWFNDPEVTQFLARTFPLYETEEEEWVENLSKSKTSFPLGIVTIQDPKLIGTVGLHEINWQQRTATTATIIGEKDYWGRGYGTEAKMLLLDFAFNALDLFAVLSRVIASNGRSLAYARKCGYEEVGRLPQWFRCQDGQRRDQVLLMVTQEKWRPLWIEYLQKTATIL